MNKNTHLKFILYARRSSESEERQVQSIDDQVHFLTQRAKEWGLEIVNVLVESKSAKKPNNRPVFSEMIERVKKGEVNGILCWQINRLSRNPVDSGEIQWLLQREAILSIRTTDREYLPSDNAVIFSVESSVANQFIIDLSKNTKRGLYSKFKKGILPGLAPLGYMNDTVKKIIIPDPERFDIVRRMFDYLLSGAYNPAEIHQMAINEWGLTNRRNGKRGGKPMSRSSMYRLFTNPFYAGIIEYNGERNIGIHKPTVTTEEYDKVQVILGDKGKPRKKTHEFAFTGLMKCPECGCGITAEEKTKYIKTTKTTKEFIYYRCTRRRNKKDFKCSQPPIGGEDLELQIGKILESIHIPAEFLELGCDVIKNSTEQTQVTQQKIYENQLREIENKKKQKQSLLDMRLRDLISEDEFTSQRDKLDHDIQHLEQESKKYSNPNDRLEPVYEAFTFAALAHERFVTGHHKKKRTIAKKLGSQYFLNDRKLQFELNESLKPFIKGAQAIKETLEPTQAPINKSKNGDLTPLRLIMGG